MIGLTVLFKSLGGNQETIKAVQAVLGKVIDTVNLDENKLIFKFTDGTGLKMFDNGQCCCESRYMATADDLAEFEGSKLLDFELKNAPDAEGEWGVHEVQFLDVVTDKGVFQMANHNEHNGYYGGFCVEAELC